tara:strand:+ start:7474 stop:8043 length:570 start_codon:yes stop_codon:yes gene_type:complete
MSLNPISFTGVTASGLVVTDGSTTNNNVKEIIVSAGTITDSTGNTVTITTGGGGGGGSGTVTNIATSAPITGGPITTTGTIGISAATTAAAGSMSAADKTKLDGITSGDQSASIAGGGGSISQIVVTDSAVTATNVIVFSLELATGLDVAGSPPVIRSRSASTSFTIGVDIINPTPDALDYNVNYVIIG